MNRYLAFLYRSYYPAGGARDLVGSYSTMGAAWEAIVERSRADSWQGDNGHILDTQTGERFDLDSDELGDPDDMV
jgi:hypothetical protein